MYNYRSNSTVTDCTFSGNTADTGGGMHNRYDSTPTVTNCVLWGDMPDELVNSDQSVPTIRFSDVQGGLPVGAVDGGGNIDPDPMFVRLPDPGPDGEWDGVDDDYGDLRLQGGSPCIDAGDPDFGEGKDSLCPPDKVELCPPRDLDGHARVLCGRVDMGAYEFGIGDYDCDQAVELEDFAAWESCMNGPQGGAYQSANLGPHSGAYEFANLGPHSGPYESAPSTRSGATPTCESFDFDGDGDVDLGDFQGWQRLFSLP